MKRLLHHSAARIALLAILAVLLEIFVFHFHHWTSLFYERPISFQVAYGSGLEERDGLYFVTDPENAYIEITCSPAQIRSLHLDLARMDTSVSMPVTVEIMATDEGSAYPYALPERTIYEAVGRSQYITLHLSGQTERLLIYIKNPATSGIQIRNLAVNPIYPLSPSLPRLAACFILLLACYALRPRNGWYRVLCNPGSRRQKAVLALFACAQILLFFFLIRAANYSTDPADSPYPALAEALAEGHFYLDDEPHPNLVAMENPYDTGARDEFEISYKWDYAYYEGKYYVYFGVTPVLLFYLPYYLITGEALTLQVTFYFCAVFFVIGALLLLWKLVTTRFKKTPFLIFLMTAAAFINGIGSFYLFSHPKFYSEANLFALMFAVWGLYFWFRALHMDSRRGQAVSFAAGSFCIALIAGCRPQMLLLCFLSVPLMWKYFCRRENRRMFLIFLFPLVAFGVWTMYYNYARFGSVFDFGATYNLTSNDMTRRGFVLGRIPLGLFSYLLQPVQLNSQFPYIEQILVESGYMGITITEPLYGGFFWTAPLAAMCFGSHAVKTQLKEKNLWGFSLLSILFALVLVILDTEMAGILPRYYSDFSIFFFLPALFCLLSILETSGDDISRNRWLLLTVILCAVGLIYQFFMIFADQDTNLSEELFQKISYLIQFWK